ncbi:beta-N-acetylhexosaminidase [Burkholderia metallica]|uniref:beta-N-acetylhexosaminidase n=1 Tax=Burkholderia metallica TaxID=488729 RepID=UPI0034A068E1|nr:beta-N-acetylhexosaminidase [Burkholderia metallica]
MMKAPASEATRARHAPSSSRFILGLLCTLSCCVPTLAQASLPLMPVPKSLETADGSLAVRGAFGLNWHGCNSTLLDRAGRRFQRDVDRLAGVDPDDTVGPSLDIDCRSGDPAATADDGKEAYRLAIGTNGVQLRADGPTGVLRGLATLRQLIRHAGREVSLPLLTVDDAPRFAWRGIMIDVARHFMTVSTLKRQIDAMELVKLNVLHLHLSDNEAFRVESLRYPALQKSAADGRYYTQAEMRDLVAYAADRGVSIVPEFDLPGHTGAIVTAYPELGAGRFDRHDPQSVMNVALDPANERTYRFVDRLLGEMATLFPDRYLHVGGDELGPKAWSDNPAIMAFAREKQLASPRALEAYFQARIRAIAAKYGKKTIGWDEVADLPDYGDTVIQTWRTSNGISKVAEAGGKVIVSSGYYLDHQLPASAYYGVDPTDPGAFGITAQEADAARKISPRVRHVVDGFVVAPRPPLTPAQQRLILGGEAALWSEQVTDEMLDAKLWPVSAAIAERFWSPADVRDLDDMYARLFTTQNALRLLGLQDRGNRERMVARLAPDRAGAVETLLDTVRPVQFIGHDRTKRAALAGKPAGDRQASTGLADAAAIDTPLAHRFLGDVQRLVNGDRSRAAPLEAQLRIWRDNPTLYRDAAAGRPELEAALPVSDDLAEMARGGLAAIEALRNGQTLPADAAARVAAVLDRAAAAEQASSTYLRSAMMAQPPADLIVTIAPGIRALVKAAAPASGTGGSNPARQD